MRTPLTLSLVAAAVLAATPAFAADLSATIRKTTTVGPGDPIGTVTVSQSPGGARFTVDLKGLPPGPHGFHVHQNGSCEPSTGDGQAVPAGAAGGHLDPAGTGHHQGPEKPGHLGDLPVLTASADGAVQTTVVAPRITDLSAIKGRALMIHAGGDNYSDSPAPLGGGGARFACGVLD